MLTPYDSGNSACCRKAHITLRDLIKEAKFAETRTHGPKIAEVRRNAVSAR